MHAKIPGSLNSKCNAARIDAEVKIIQRWDGYRPDYRLLCGSFYADLVGKKNNQQQPYREYSSKARSQFKGSNNGSTPETYRYIEDALLKTAIEDYRKHAIDIIIIPYLVVIKGMTDRNQIYDIVMQWLDKCSELRRLEPSRHEFSVRVRTRIDEVMMLGDQAIAPMKLETLKRESPWLYEKLQYR
jgi:hypothetical protein